VRATGACSFDLKLAESTAIRYAGKLADTAAVAIVSS